MPIIQSLKQSAIGRWIKRSPRLRDAAIFVSNVVFRPPYFRRRVRLNIGGAGTFDLDYRFGHFHYEEFGAAHNAGFRVWQKLCAGRRVIFDVGAHIGLYTLPASRAAGSDGAVYAFEPSPANIAMLERHSRYNRLTNVRICPFLVGDASEEAVPFYESPGADAMNSVVLVKDPQVYRRVMRKQDSLDHFCLKRGLVPDVIKIDVEGTEINVLRGAMSILQAHHPAMVLSVHPSRIEKLGQSVADLEALLRTLGYDIFDPELKPVRGPLGFAEYILTYKG